MQKLLSEVRKLRGKEEARSEEILGPWRLLLSRSGGSALADECMMRGSMLARGLMPGTLVPSATRLQSHEAVGRLECPAPGSMQSLGQIHRVATTVAQAARNRAGQTNLSLGITQCGVVRKDQAAAFSEVVTSSSGLRGAYRQCDDLCWACLESRGFCQCVCPLPAPPARPLLLTERDMDIRLSLGPGGQWLLKEVAVLGRKPRRLALACVMGRGIRLLPLDMASHLGVQSCDKGFVDLPTAVVDDSDVEEAMAAAELCGLRRVVRAQDLLFSGSNNFD